MSDGDVALVVIESSNYVKILTDDIEENNPILEFKRYRDAIVSMIRGSTPKFSIGIYGEWGTGKTILMKMVEDKLQFCKKRGLYMGRNYKK